MFCRLLLVCAVLVATSGCRRAPQNIATPPIVSAASTYEVRGVIQRTDPASRKAIIDHDTIAGYMDAMTMEFTAAQESDLQGLAPGDVVTFRLHVHENHSWIDECRKTGERREVTPTAPPQNQPGLAIGDLLPDCDFIDESGKSRRLSEFRGQVLALTFFFTRCPLPDFCPRLSRRFAETQSLLARAETPPRCHFLSLSIDPDHDTPEALAAYAGLYAAEPDQWTFATGPAAKILPFAATCGVSISANGALLDHNLRTLVVDAEGRVRQILSGNEWTQQTLLDEIARAGSPVR